MVCSRAAFDAKVVTSTRPRALATCSAMPLWTPSSDPEAASWKTLVESHTKARTPSSPIWVSTSGLDASPSTGVSSIFQSPVWNTRPNGVSINTPLPSGIECDSATKRTLNGPSSIAAVLVRPRTPNFDAVWGATAEGRKVSARLRHPRPPARDEPPLR